MKRALMLLLVGSVVAPLVAQQTWLVRCGVGGPPVHFHDLPQAVAAAAPGDTIRFFIDDQAIAPCGPVFRFSPVVIDKPLTVVGFAEGIADCLAGQLLRSRRDRGEGHPSG
jgi:hypothetical protein